LRKVSIELLTIAVLSNINSATASCQQTSASGMIKTVYMVGECENIKKNSHKIYTLMGPQSQKHTGMNMFKKYEHKIIYWSNSCDDGNCGDAADDDDGDGDGIS
jgi:hypothetical protein